MVRLKVRPFCERFNRGSVFPLLEITGAIVEQRFVISVDSGELVLPVLGLGHDQRGQYAWLEEARYDGEGGVRLTLSAQRQGERLVGAQMTFGASSSNNDARSSFTIFFGEHGMVDGQALVRPASEFPTVLH